MHVTQIDYLAYTVKYRVNANRNLRDFDAKSGCGWGGGRV